MFTFKLIQPDGTPADPPQFVTAVPNWHEGDTFLLRPGRVDEPELAGVVGVETVELKISRN